jgi:hypothetical protein
MDKNMKRRWFFMGLKFVSFAVLAVIACGWIVMSLWNWLLPSLFGFGVISFWQALGVILLTRLLVGGLFKRRHRGGHWKSRMGYRYGNMSPEEQANFRCGARHWKAHWEVATEVPGDNSDNPAPTAS